MSWTWGRRLLVVGGVVYAFSLIPSSIRPSWSAAPLRKPDQTLTVAQGTSLKDVNARIKSKCTAAWLFRPVMGSAKHVQVVVENNGKTVSAKDFNCAVYV